MSPIVVGTKRSPATMPHKYDCGFRNTMEYGCKTEAHPDGAGFARVSDGVIAKRSTPTTRLAMASPCQMVCHPTPCSSHGPTTNWPAEPPSIPRHWVTPMAVASQRAENPCEARYTAPVKAKAEPAPCNSLPAYPALATDTLKSRHPIASMKRPMGTA